MASKNGWPRSSILFSGKRAPILMLHKDCASTMASANGHLTYIRYWHNRELISCVCNMQKKKKINDLAPEYHKIIKIFMIKVKTFLL